MAQPQTTALHYDDLPFEFRALELALEVTCMSLDAQEKELEPEINPVLDELASSISTPNLECVRRFKGHLLALTQRVQKVCDEIEHLMDDDGDMAEMYLTDKKERRDTLTTNDLDDQLNISQNFCVLSKSTPLSPVGSNTGIQKLQRAFSTISTSKQGSLFSSSNSCENIDQLEMLLEAYFVVIDNTLNKLLSRIVGILLTWRTKTPIIVSARTVEQLKEYIDDTEDLINIKLGIVQNQLIKFELLLTAATFVATIFAVVTAVFGMNFEDSIFYLPTTFNWVLVLTGFFCISLYLVFLIYFRHKKKFPL